MGRGHPCESADSWTFTLRPLCLAIRYSVNAHEVRLSIWEESPECDPEILLSFGWSDYLLALVFDAPLLAS